MGRNMIYKKTIPLTVGSSNLPPVPPKRTPLLPPKQAVGKSREDIDRITKVLKLGFPTIFAMNKICEKIGFSTKNLVRISRK